MRKVLGLFLPRRKTLTTNSCQGFELPHTAADWMAPYAREGEEHGSDDTHVRYVGDELLQGWSDDFHVLKEFCSRSNTQTGEYQKAQHDEGN